MMLFASATILNFLEPLRPFPVGGLPLEVSDDYEDYLSDAETVTS